MPIADVMRYTAAGLGLILVPSCIYAAFARILWDQRVRFVALALIGVVVIGGQLDALGKPANWRMPILIAALILANVGTVMYLVRVRRHNHAVSD